MTTLFKHESALPKLSFSNMANFAKFLIGQLALRAARKSDQSLQVLESVPVAAQASLALVRFNKETFVLGITAQHITVLAKDGGDGALTMVENR